MCTGTGHSCFRIARWCIPQTRSTQVCKVTLVPIRQNLLQRQCHDNRWFFSAILCVGKIMAATRQDRGKRNLLDSSWAANLFASDQAVMKWEESAWVRHSSTWEELDKFKCLEAKCRGKNPGKVRARTYGTKSPSRSEALRFIDSAKSPSTKIDGSLVNFRRRLSNRHGRPRRMLTMDIRRNTDRTVSTSTWFAQVGSTVRIELGLIAGSAEWLKWEESAWIRHSSTCRLESMRLKFTNEPSIFVDGDLAESIKRSASDRLGDLVP